MKERVTVTLILSIVLVLMATTAQGSPRSYDFSVLATTGPLANTSAEGTFTFDSGIIPSGGGNVDVAGLLSSLSFTWDGIAYDSTTANTGRLAFDNSGDLIGEIIGTTCGNGFCTLFDHNVDAWSFVDATFLYTVPGGGDVFNGTVSVSPVPEPSTILLIGAGLAGVGIMRRRFKK